MNIPLYKSSILLGVCFVAIQNLAIAQDTLWVRKSAPASLETYAVAFSEDGSKVISGSECSPSYMRLFNTASGNQLWDYQLGSSLMCVQGVKLSTSGTKAAAMEEMGNLLIFDYTGATPTLTNTISTGTSYAFGLDFSPDGTRIVTGCSDKMMNIYRVADGIQLHTTIAHNAWVLSVDWSPKGNFIVTGGNDNTVKLWDTTGTLVRTMTGHTGAVQTVHFSLDGNYIVSGAKDDKIKIWEVSTGNLVRTIAGHTGDVMQVDVSDDGTKIVSGSADSTIRVWSFSGNQLMSFKQRNSGTVYSVDFAPNGRYVAAGTANGDVQLWDIQKATAVADLPTANNQFSVFPNPCKDGFTIRAEKTFNGLLFMTDVAGRTLLQKDFNGTNLSVDISSFAAGQYELMAVANDGSRRQFKIVKQ